MSNYDKTVSHYAAELGLSERQIRRYCERRLIPSAELVKGRTGRPKWSIKDTSLTAIQRLRVQLMFECYAPPTFFEPIPLRHCQKAADGRLRATSTEIAWRPIYVAPIRDPYAWVVQRCHQAALLLHDLTESDITNPPVIRNKHGLFLVSPTHEKKVLAMDRTEARLVYGLCKSRQSKQYRLALRLLTMNLRESDILQAGARLGMFHRIFGIEITHLSLARVLGMSKSSLYRTYGRLVGNALRLANQRGASPGRTARRPRFWAA
jgi:hypothetical protein